MASKAIDGLMKVYTDAGLSILDIVQTSKTLAIFAASEADARVVAAHASAGLASLGTKIGPTDVRFDGNEWSAVIDVLAW